MRTNVVLDETLVERAKALTGIKTTRAVIDEALHLLIQLREQSQVAESARPAPLGGRPGRTRESRTDAYEVTAEGPAPYAAG